MEEKSDKKPTLKKRKYEKPAVTKLTQEQAKLKLLAHAKKGDEGAKKLLELISADSPPKESKPKKKSA
jgi:hypothetical protein